jgi:hypothetical protein
LFGFEKAKSRLHIVWIVLIHVAGWSLFFFFPMLLYPARIDDRIFFEYELIDKLVLVILFYLNYYLLIPRFFEKKKYLVYFSAVILAFFIYLGRNVAVISSPFKKTGGQFGALHFSEGRPDTVMSLPFTPGMSGVGIKKEGTSNNYVFMTNIPGDNFIPDSTRTIFSFPLEEDNYFGLPGEVFLMTVNRCLSPFLLLFLIGGFLRLTYSFLRSQNEKKALENARLNAEVNFLKSQINPHFLFNTLNSIYSQAHMRSVETEYSILKLSDILRYVLYDSAAPHVDLSKDIQYLSNYVDLQKIRLSQKVTLNYKVIGNPYGKKIAPLLLITFVENAFKHGVSYHSPSTIGVNINIFEQSLTMVVTNPVIESNSFENTGLGLKNVQRRLDLLYAGKYLLDIVHNEHLHIVNLKIELE